MRWLYEGYDDDCCDEDSYKEYHHVLGHTISLINWFLLVVGNLVLIASNHEINI
jgi:hypothetical protein